MHGNVLVAGEDPTVNRLQRYAAEVTGKEAALFIPTGTMANLVAVLALCGRGGEVCSSHVNAFRLTQDIHFACSALMVLYL